MFIQTIKSLPDQARRDVYFRLVGSLNARVIYAVQSHLREQKRATREAVQKAHALEELNTKYGRTVDDFNIEQSMKEPVLGPDETPAPNYLELAHSLHSIRQYFLDELTGLSRKETNVSYKEALNYMLERPEREFTDEELSAIEECTGVSKDDLKTIAKLDRARSVGELRKYQEDILGIVNEFGDGIADDDAAEDAFSDLRVELQEALIEKAVDGLNAARNNVILLMMRHSSKANLGDLPLIKAAIDKLAA